jgi:hypothetical protein
MAGNIALNGNEFFKDMNWNKTIESTPDGSVYTFRHREKNIYVEILFAKTNDISWKITVNNEFAGASSIYSTDVDEFINKFIYNGGFMTFLTTRKIRVF